MNAAAVSNILAMSGVNASTSFMLSDCARIDPLLTG